MRVARAVSGFTLLEVLIGVLLSTLLMTGIVQLLTASVSTYRLQLAQNGLEDSGRYARDVLMSHIAQAGYQPEPWLEQPVLPALTDETTDGATSRGDQLGLQRWSRHNCYGNANPVTDSNDRPAFYLLRVRFTVSASANLTLTCRYGPDAAHLHTQINNLGLIENIESMQLLYAEDSDHNGFTDNWVSAQTWGQESAIKSIKVALLLSTPQPLNLPAGGLLRLLDQTVSPPADGRLRKVRSFTAAIRGRLG